MRSAGGRYPQMAIFEGVLQTQAGLTTSGRTWGPRGKSDRQNFVSRFKRLKGAPTNHAFDLSSKFWSTRGHRNPYGWRVTLCAGVRGATVVRPHRKDAPSHPNVSDNDGFAGRCSSFQLIGPGSI